MANVNLGGAPPELEKTGKRRFIRSACEADAV